MVFFLTFLWALPSGVLWFINAEAMMVYQVNAEPSVPPWMLAAATVCGQFLGYAALYHFASRALSRFERVRRATAKVQLQGPGWGTWTMFFTGGLVGMPPLLALFALYGSNKVVPYRLLMACALPGRFAWYCGWGYAADFMRDNFTFF